VDINRKPVTGSYLGLAEFIPYNHNILSNHLFQLIHCPPPPNTGILVAGPEIFPQKPYFELTTLKMGMEEDTLKSH
jgi:hypothetical protein